MNPKNVYESIVKLLFNVVRNDELKYHLYKDKKYLSKFAVLVGDLLNLEFNENAEYKDLKWSRTFGKAIVIISQERQRIEKTTSSLEEIYKDYTKFIAFTKKNYEVTNLEETTIAFTQDDVLYDAKLDQEKINFFEEAEQKAKEAEELAKSATENNSKTNDAKEDANNTDQKEQSTQTNNQNYDQSFNTFFNQKTGDNFPVHPMADPRFYPYTKKQKWFPAMKIALGILVIFLTLFLAVVPIFLMANPVNFPEDLYMLGGFPTDKGTLGDLKGKLTMLALPISSWQNILNIILLFTAGGLLSYFILRKPKSLKEKYRLSWFTLLIILYMAIMNIYSFYWLIDPNTTLKKQWFAIFSKMIDSSKVNSDDWIQAFNDWWSYIYKEKNVAFLQGFSIAGLVVSLTLTVTIIGVMIAQPHLDQEKINHANEEYQIALTAAMQGKNYQMDPNLFEKEDEVIIGKKSKFKLWKEKHSKKKKKDKEKGN